MTRAKRAFDLVFSFVGLLLACPLFLAIAGLVKAEDGGSVFFRQERVGRGGRRFLMWKFRTMVPTAERIGPQLTTAGDSRITRVGTWLRRQKLDELPQLFNVVTGDMTLVGPRPEVPRYVAMYTPEQRTILELAPGITDRASVAFADESALLATVADPERFYIECIVPEKIRLSLDYAKRATTLRDFGVVLQTLARLVPRVKGKVGVKKPTSSHPTGG